MFLTKEKFLEYFPPKTISKEQFIKEFHVMYKTPQTLAELFSKAGKKPIIKSDDDARYQHRNEIIEYFYQILVTDRYKYLACFYEAYFQFKDPRTLSWSGVSLSIKNPIFDAPVISLQKNDASRRIIRNLFHLELLHLTKVTNTVKSRVSFWESLLNLYNRFELEDRFFAPSSIGLFLREKGTQREKRSGIREINYNNLFYLFQAYQPKASIFNPYAIKWILSDILPAGKTIFTPVLSWGSYLTAYMHVSSYTHYVGVDVMPTVCQKCEFLAQWYRDLDAQFQHKRTEMICTPSESLNNNFLSKFRNYFDTILICPPYYDMEIYHEGQQSISLYPDYKTWLPKYWEATVKACQRVCKTGGTFAVIANDYHTLDKKSYPLTSDRPYNFAI